MAVSAAPYSVRWAGRLAVLTGPDEIDVSNAGRLLDKLLSVLDREPVTVIVDLTGTTFCDSAGMNAIVRARKRAAAEQVELRLVVAALAVRRVFAVTGLDRMIDIYPSLAASLAAGPPARAGQSVPQTWQTDPLRDTDPGAAGSSAPAGDPAGPGGR